MRDDLSAQEKGAAFEELFAAHMLERCGFSEAKLNQQLKGKLAARAYEVDVVGIRKIPLWRVVYVFAVLIIAAGILTMLRPRAVPQVTNTMKAAGTRVEKAVGFGKAGVGILAIGAMAFVLGVVGDRRSRRRVWVECKNRKATIKRADMFKTISSVEDARAYAGSRKKDAIHDVWYVSTADYDCDAVTFAKAKGIRLFRAIEGREGVAFERVE